MSVIKPNIAGLGAYVVEQGPSRVKLNQNESSLDIPVLLKKQIFDRMASSSWNRYPPGDAGALIRAISGYTNHPESAIMVGNGSNELIQTLVYATCDKGDRVVIVKPGFSVYERVAEIMNIEVTEVPLLEDFGFDTEGLVRACRGAGILILSTPNNPTGTTLNPDEIRRIAERVSCLVAVDEAYYEFSGETVQSFVQEYDNIVVLRTFSKALRLANLRLGYLLGPKALIKELEKCRLPFSVGSFQQIAGEVVLENKGVFLDYAKLVIRERKRVFHELQQLKGITPTPSHANFILFETSSIGGREMYTTLLKKGVLIRYFDTPHLADKLRVTIGTPEENDTFLQVLREVLTRREDDSRAF
ncbi:MAG: histidinol-phosphate transaminase [Candidatus Aminicenantes bacterium]|nr:histidinol-phosphate transaminase [Candidatus Aminicenantes bacterium]